jgi:hypothetical protein
LWEQCTWKKHPEAHGSTASVTSWNLDFPCKSSPVGFAGTIGTLSSTGLSKQLHVGQDGASVTSKKRLKLCFLWLKQRTLLLKVLAINAQVAIPTDLNLNIKKDLYFCQQTIGGSPAFNSEL